MKPNAKTQNDNMLHLPTELPEATKLRLKLLANGYRPLPTAEKVAFQKGWPQMPVTPDIVRSWPMMGPGLKPAVTTAIQLTGTMLAIDVDVQDAAVSRQIEKIMAEVFGDDVMDAAPLRTSGGAKFMVLVQTETPFKQWKTPKMIDADGRDHMVEVYGGAATRYFSCFGPHTLGGVVKGDYEVLKSYAWANWDDGSEGPSPLNTRPEELPLITEEQLNLFLMKATDLMDQVDGWEEVKGATHGHYEGGVAYDLTEDMTFETKSGVLTYYEALAYAMDERDARCSSSFLDGESRNTGKCRMAVVGSVADDDLALSVFDHETWVMHYPASWAPRTAAERQGLATSVGEAMNRLMPAEAQKAIDEAAEEGADVEAFEKTVYELMDDLAFNNVSGAIHYLNRRAVIWNHVGKTTVKGRYAPFDLTWTGPRGGNRRYSPVDAWSAFDDKLQVAGVRFEPRTTARVYKEPETGEVYANGFFGLTPPGDLHPGLVELIDDFMEHLVPDEEEREWLWDWMAEKYQRPWTRNCAILFIAAGVQGAGRGTLFSILSAAFNGYTASVSESDLLGARFNSFMENNLLVFSNELGGLGWHERKRGYETLKDRVDPNHTQVTIERKGIEAYNARTYASFMLATNQPGAMPMDAEDRRMAVITNGGKLAGPLLDRFKEIGEVKVVAAILGPVMARLLADRQVERNVSDAPMFSGREEMLAANDTDLDAAIQEVVDEAGPDRAWVRSDFVRAVKVKMGRVGGSVPGLQQAVNNLVGKRAERVGAELMRGKVRVGTSAVSLVAKNSNAVLAASAEERAEICMVASRGPLKAVKK